MFSFNYHPNYFSIEHILATREKIPCKTNITFLRLGFLDPDSGEENLPRGTNLNAPLWLIQNFHQKDLNFLTVKTPNAFQEKARDAFEADATVVNLFRVNPNFFELGLCFSQLNHRESDLVKDLLIKVFRSRFKIIFEWSMHRMTEPTKIQELDLSEQMLLKAGQKAIEQLDEWILEFQFHIKPAEAVVNLEKRKLLKSN